jgi:hypothetical protein
MKYNTKEMWEERKETDSDKPGRNRPPNSWDEAKE